MLGLKLIHVSKSGYSEIQWSMWYNASSIMLTACVYMISTLTRILYEYTYVWISKLCLWVFLLLESGSLMYITNAIFVCLLSFYDFVVWAFLCWFVILTVFSWFVWCICPTVIIVASVWFIHAQSHDGPGAMTVTSKWAQRRLKSPPSRLFTQPFIRVQIKENIKAPRHRPLCGEFTGDRLIPRTNGQ